MHTHNIIHVYAQLLMQVHVYLLPIGLGREGLSRRLKSTVGKHDILGLLLPGAVLWVVDES